MRGMYVRAHLLATVDRPTATAAAEGSTPNKGMQTVNKQFS